MYVLQQNMMMSIMSYNNNNNNFTQQWTSFKFACNYNTPNSEDDRLIE